MATAIIRPIDSEAMRAQYVSATPFPFFQIDDFLDSDFALEVAASYPSYESARRVGREFNKANERLKIQVTSQSEFPTPVKKLADALSSPEWLRQLSEITGIPLLLADPEFRGGGMHMTGPGGRLDVHVDFNYLAEDQLHRRLNILIYLNPKWEENWGGRIELWDSDIKRCHYSLNPAFNRCLVFETSDISFHGVTPITAPATLIRRSFAAYYYTKEAPHGWDGAHHSTIFRARPNERLRKYLRIPAENMANRLIKSARQSMRAIKARLTGE